MNISRSGLLKLCSFHLNCFSPLAAPFLFATKIDGHLLEGDVLAGFEEGLLDDMVQSETAGNLRVNYGDGLLGKVT